MSKNTKRKNPAGKKKAESLQAFILEMLFGQSLKLVVRKLQGAGYTVQPDLVSFLESNYTPHMRIQGTEFIELYTKFGIDGRMNKAQKNAWLNLLGQLVVGYTHPPKRRKIRSRKISDDSQFNFIIEE